MGDVSYFLEGRNTKEIHWKGSTMNKHIRRMAAVFVVAFASMFSVPSHGGDGGAAGATIAVGGFHALAIKADGSLWAWGGNKSGQLGVGDTAERETPVRVGDASNWKSVSAGGGHSLAIRADGSLWAWGKNTYGQLGVRVGDTIDKNTPTRVGADSDWKAVSAGGDHSLAIKSDGSLWGWGHSEYGQIGNGSYMFAWTIPKRVGTGNNWKAVSAGRVHSFAIQADGSLWAWGQNLLGSAPKDGSGVPVRVGGANGWAAVSASIGGGHALAIKNDGSLWAWGANKYGQLGAGDTTDREAPVRVGAASDWKMVSAGGRHSLAIKKDGSIWAWGSNKSGQLGTGDTTDKNTPTRAGADNGWKAVSACGDITLAIKADGGLWAWGAGPDGQPANGKKGDSASRVQVGTGFRVPKG